MSRGFITDDLPKEGPDDWVCVYDFCGSLHLTGYHEPMNVSADWSPSRKQVFFCGQWNQVTPMPASSEPTEDQVWDWAVNDRCHWARRHRALCWREKCAHERNRARDRYFKAHGFNWITVVFTSADGSHRTVSHRCGLMGWQHMLHAAVGFMIGKMPAGTRITKFKHETGLTEAEIETRSKKAA